MKATRKKLPPMPPNLGVMNSPLFEPLTEIMDAIQRWEEGERPKDKPPTQPNNPKDTDSPT